MKSPRSPRAFEIDQLVYFIRTADLSSARRSLVSILGRGEHVSREILAEFSQLESKRV